VERGHQLRRQGSCRALHNRATTKNNSNQGRGGSRFYRRRHIPSIIYHRQLDRQRYRFSSHGLARRRFSATPGTCLTSPVENRVAAQACSLSDRRGTMSLVQCSGNKLAQMIRMNVGFAGMITPVFEETPSNLS
jgi:hypothetical protein